MFAWVSDYRPHSIRSMWGKADFSILKKKASDTYRLDDDPREICLNGHGSSARSTLYYFFKAVSSC